MMIAGVVVLLGMLSVTLSSPAAQVRGGNIGDHTRRGWVLDNRFDIPFWIAKHVEPARGSKVQRRELFLFIEPRYFSPENLEKIFTEFAAQYQLPKRLYITTFTDAEMLERAIRTSLSQICVQFLNTPEGREDRARFNKMFFPLDEGYFRAYYSRNIDGDQSFQYSPDSGKKELVELPIVNRVK
jgi:hypothetical protein